MNLYEGEVLDAEWLASSDPASTLVWLWCQLPSNRAVLKVVWSVIL